MKASSRFRLIAGITLVFIGVLIAFLLIMYQYNMCAHQWINNLDGFGKKYVSVWDCFITRSLGAIILSLVIGAASIWYGVRLCIFKTSA